MENEEKAVALKKPVALAMGRKGYLIPDSLDSQWQMAVIFSKSGVVPKDMARVETIFTAIQLGSEVGLAPMQAIQSIAVINGRPTIWGDAQLALCKASPDYDYIKEKVEGAGPNMVATCELKRKSEVVPVVQTFSVEDAKTAKLWMKQGPWTQYPKRMLQMRARSFAIRDAFPDVLKGLTVTQEEAIDMVASENGAYEAVEVNDVIKKVNKETGEVKPSPEKDLGVWDPSHWKNLRSAGFANYVEDNLDELLYSSESVKLQVREKWLKIYDNEAAGFKKFPLDPEVEEEQEAEAIAPEHVPEEPETPPEVEEKEDNPMVLCPMEEEETSVSVAFCNSGRCNMRKGCPAHQ